MPPVGATTPTGVRDSDTDDVVLLRHGRPAAVMISARRHEELIRDLKDAEDKLSIYEAEGDTNSPVPAALRDSAQRVMELGGSPRAGRLQEMAANVEQHCSYIPSIVTPAGYGALNILGVRTSRRGER